MLNVVPWNSLLGGVLLGVSAVILLLLNGKIAGISGVLNGLLIPKRGETFWRVLFIIGMMAGGLMGVIWFGAVIPELNPDLKSSNIIQFSVAGLFVGLGTYIGNGCTSGHGICGIGRLSKRSMVATSIFMLVAAVTVFVRLHVI